MAQINAEFSDFSSPVFSHLFKIHGLADLFPDNKADDPIDHKVDHVNNYYQDPFRSLHGIRKLCRLLLDKKDAGKRDQKIKQSVKKSARPYIVRLPVQKKTGKPEQAGTDRLADYLPGHDRAVDRYEHHMDISEDK